MPILVQCADCGAKYNVAATMAGKKLRCKKCGGVFSVPSAPPASSPQSDEPDLSSLSAEDEPAPQRSTAGQKSPDRSSTASPHRRPGTTSYGSRIQDNVIIEGPEEDDNQADEDDTPSLAANPAFEFPSSRVLDAAVPYLIALVAIGWMILATLHADNSGRPWLGHLRWFLYLLAYTIIVYPITMMGVRMAGEKLRFGMPNAHAWKIYSIFSLPFMLGLILSLTGGSIANYAAGLIVGLLVSLSLFLFLYRLRQSQIGGALGMISGFHIGGAVVAALVGVGINLAVLSGLKAANSADTFNQSPLGPAFAWNVPPRDPTSPKSHGPVVINTDPDPVLTTRETSQPSSQPTTTASTQPVVTVAINSADNNSNPAKSTEKMTTDPLIPKTDPTTMAVKPPTTTSTTAPATPLSPFIASVTTNGPIGEFDDIAFCNLSGSHAALVVKSRGPSSDDIEIWNTQPLEKRASLAVTHSANEHPAYWLGPKGTYFAKMIDFPRKSIQIRSATEDKLIRVFELDTTRLGNPDIIGFAMNNQIAVLWELNSEFGVEMLDTSTGQRTRIINLPKFEKGKGNYAISPDGRLFAAAVKGRVVLPGVRVDPAAPDANLPAPAIQVSDVSGGRLAPRLYPVSSLGPEKNASFSGLIFSADSQKLSMLYEEAGNCLVVTWKLPDLRPISQYTLFSSRPSGSTGEYDGHALEFLPGASTWLLYGTTVIDGDRVLGELGVPNVKGHQVMEADQLGLLVPGNEDNKQSIVTVRLNPEKLPTGGNGTKPPKPR
jgi:hypothetical protein